MKPEKLVMSAFGSYGGMEIIDFNKVSNGVFLITGDTGSGKTTIFDAITYALFDQTSGGKRSGDMMRSQYADENALTFVELTFIYDKETYKIRRNPNYPRISKRRNKDGEASYTMENASVELTMPNGQVFFGKKRETNEKIQEILGITVNQFTQISMIAQDEFLKLLHAPSKERKEIFGRIFDTGIYEQMQNRLKEQSRDLKSRLEDNRKLCEHELSGVRHLPDSVYQGQWEEASHKPETGMDEILHILDEIINETKQKEKTFQEESKKNQKRTDEVKLELKQATEINQLFDQEQDEKTKISELGKKQNEQLTMEEEWKRKQETAEKEYRTRLPELEQNIGIWKGLLPKYDLLKQRQKELDKVQNKKEQIISDTGKVEKALLLSGGKIEELEKKQEQLSDEISVLPQWQQKEKEYRQQQDILTEMCNNMKQLQKQVKKRNERKEALEQALTISHEKILGYEEKNRIFIEEQAGVMAAGLIEGAPCPVCGATNHPSKAKLSQKAVSQSQVEQAKKEREKAERNLEEQKTGFQRENEEYKALESRISQDGFRIFGAAFTYDMPEPALKENGKSLAEAKKQNEELAQKQTLYERKKLELEGLRSRQKQQQQQKETLTESLYEVKLSGETLQHTIQELLDALPFQTELDLKQRLEKAHKEKESLELQQKKSHDALQRLRQELAKTEGTLQEKRENYVKLQQRLEGKRRIDTEQLLLKERECLKEQKELEKRRMELAVLENRNSQAKGNLESIYREKLRILEEYQLVERLAQVANGNLRQQARMDLQTYVQRRYFGQIIDAANKRLTRMNGSRFLLQCRELEHLGRQGEVGLDLDVYDMITDKIRDVKTLSGGESFLAALAMALGMSDLIQFASGKVHLDTMFIDEGFGSLDDEARSRAIQILHELAGETRLVGIISHVTELKEEMDRKLAVTKSDRGSKVQWILESFGKGME